MTEKGLVVPDNPSPTDYITVPFRIPNDPQWIGIIAGLLFSPCNGYWWKKSTGDWELARDTMCSIASEFGVNLTEFCEQVEACIQDSETIRDIIDEIVTEETTETIQDTIFGDAQRELGIGLSALDGCDPDIVFGICTGIVDYIDAQIRDAIEIVEVASNILEVLNIWVGATPVIGDLVIVLSDYASWLQETIGENYVAQYTTVLRDNLRCALFCEWVNSPNCRLSLTQVAQVFINEIAAPDSILDDIGDLIGFALTGVWGGTEIVEIMFVTAVGMMAVSSGAIPFITIPVVYEFEKVVALSSNNPDSDWEILCGCVPDTWNYCWLGGAGFTPAWNIVPFGGGSASYDAVNDRIVGYKNPPANGAAFVDMNYDLDGATVTKIDVTFSYRATRTSATDFIRLYVNGSIVASSGISGTGTQTLTYEPLVGETVEVVRVEAAAAVLSQADAGYMYVTAIRFDGSGLNPLPPSTC